MTENQLTDLYPEGKTITVAGEQITIVPFKVGQLSKVFAAFSPIIQTITSNKDVPPVQLAINLMEANGEHFIKILAISCDKPIKWAEQLNVDDAVVLFSAVLEVNKDFFIRKVLPTINGMLEKMQ